MAREFEGKKYFDQEELDELIAKRLKRERDNKERKKEAVVEYLHERGLDEEKLEDLLSRDGRELEVKNAKLASENKQLQSKVSELSESTQSASKKLKDLLKHKALTDAIGDKADDGQRELLLKAYMSDFSVNDADEVVHSSGKTPQRFFEEYLSKNEFATRPQKNTPPPRGANPSDSSPVVDGEKPKTHFVPYANRGPSLRERIEGS